MLTQWVSVFNGSRIADHVNFHLRLDLYDSSLVCFVKAACQMSTSAWIVLLALLAVNEKPLGCKLPRN